MTNESDQKIETRLISVAYYTFVFDCQDRLCQFYQSLNNGWQSEDFNVMGIRYEGLGLSYQIRLFREVCSHCDTYLILARHANIWNHLQRTSGTV